VLEHGTFITGPAASMLLADLGADVVKSSCPAPATRSAPSRAGSIRRTTRRSTATSAASRSTPSRPTDLEKFDALVKDADVYIQNFRPGFAEQINTGIDRLRGINPQADLLRHQRLRQHRPGGAPPHLRQRGAGGQRLPRAAGEPGQPARGGPAIADLVTGFYAAYGILGALYEREKTGTAARWNCRCSRP
jgi:crotonobetainyl-CoA:carnitine CoA-transferase CaiB-like acyl-CoA transferase